MNTEQLKQLAVTALEDLKAVNISAIDVHEMTTVTNIMVVASGNSSRHVSSLADSVAMAAKKAGNPALGVEGQREGEWVLVDLGSVVVHVMQASVRDFYNLEKLWTSVAESRSEAHEDDDEA